MSRCSVVVYILVFFFFSKQKTEYDFSACLVASEICKRVIRIDQLRHANRHEGKMADQKSVVEFRGNSRDVLAYWLADRIDQMAFSTLGGRSYAIRPNGSARIGSDLPALEFAADVTAPSAKRMLRWDNVNKTLRDSSTGGNTSSCLL